MPIHRSPRTESSPDYEKLLRDSSPLQVLEIAQRALNRQPQEAPLSAQGASAPAEQYLALGVLAQCIAGLEKRLDLIGHELLAGVGSDEVVVTEGALEANPQVASTIAVFALARACELCDTLRITVENSQSSIVGLASR
ncbi:UNVERIFIED_ORG: hypothetical protein M2328_006774 [Rhodococcus erythropolis]